MNTPADIMLLKKLVKFAGCTNFEVRIVPNTSAYSIVFVRKSKKTGYCHTVYNIGMMKKSTIYPKIIAYPEIIAINSPSSNIIQMFEGISLNDKRDIVTVVGFTPQQVIWPANTTREELEIAMDLQLGQLEVGQQD